MKRNYILILFFVLIFNPSQAQEQPSWKLEASTENGLFAVSLQPKEDEPIIGSFHDWVIEVTNEKNEGIEGAKFSFGGGMELHGHGLPSQPRITQYLGNGKYLIEGMLFNMAGDWTLLVAIKKGQFTDKAIFDITLDF